MIGSVAAWLADPAHWQGAGGIIARLEEHLAYSLLAVLIAGIIAFPLGVFIGHTGKGTFIVAGTANALRALPTLGLLILLVLTVANVMPAGLTYRVPAMIVLVLLGIPPILSGTYAGVANVDPAVRDAAYGMGMTDGAVAWRVEVPVAVPLILGGVRSALLQVIATTTVIAYVSLGGLGRYVIDGLAQRDYPQMAGGSVLVAVLAIVVDVLMAGAQRVTTPGRTTWRWRWPMRRQPVSG